MNPFGSNVSPRRLCAGFLLAALLAGCGPAPEAVRDDVPTLRLTTARIRGFDPAHASDQASLLATGRIYEGLLQYAYWDRPYRVEPLLAAEMPDVSSDGLVWQFRLREGIRFSDDPCFAETGGKGRELVAQDFVYAILRIADLKVGSGGYWVYRGKIAGLDDFREASRGEAPTDYDQPVAGLRAVGPHELELHLTEPYPQLPWVLAMPYAFAVPREAVEFYGPEFVNHPVGTGPYVLAAAQQNYRYEYRANPQWQETGRIDAMPADAPTPDAGKPLPLAPRIVDSVVGDPSTAWLMFMAGQLDLVDVGRDQWDSIITPAKELRPELAARGIALSKSPQLNIRAVGENPNAASSVGVSVIRVKYIAISLSGALAGLGGAFMSMYYSQGWNSGMVAGRGFIALAAQAMGRGEPVGAMFSSLLFGLAQALRTKVSGLQGVSSYLVSLIPYVVTVLGLVIYAASTLKKVKKHRANKAEVKQ